MMLRKITDRVFYLPFREKGDRPNLGYIRGDHFSLMVDAGNSVEHAQEFLACLEQLSLPKPDFVVLTHWHWDHTFALHYICSSTRAVSFAHELTCRQLEKVKSWDWSLESMRAREATGEDIAFCNDNIIEVYPDRTQINVALPHIALHGEADIDLGGVSVRIFPLCACHSADDTVVLANDVLFCGDGLCPDYYTRGGAYEEKSLRALVQQVKSIPCQTVVSGHSLPESKAETIEYLEDELCGICTTD